MGIICDTNVILDVMLERKPHYYDSTSFLNYCEDYNIEVYVQASAITDIYYICRRYVHSKSKALSIVKQVTKLVTICEITDQDVTKALEMGGKDFEDCMLAACAIRKGATAIITRNKKDYDGLGIKVFTPKEYMVL